MTLTNFILLTTSFDKCRVFFNPYLLQSWFDVQVVELDKKREKENRPMDIIKNILLLGLERLYHIGHVASGMTFWQQYFLDVHFSFDLNIPKTATYEVVPLKSDHFGLLTIDNNVKKKLETFFFFSRFLV